MSTKSTATMSDQVVPVVEAEPAADGGTEPGRRDERGMVSAEWAVGIIAAVAIAGVLLAIITMAQVEAVLLKFILMVINSFSGFLVGAEARSRGRVTDVSRRVGRGRTGHGDAELAVTTLTAFTLFIAMCWGIYLVICRCGASTRRRRWPVRRREATTPRRPRQGQRSPGSAG
jgi:hypothetical protein